MEWALLLAVAACAVAWVLVIHYASKAIVAETAQRQAQKTSEVKDAQLESASKPNLSRAAILARMRAGKL
jgi:cell division protein FtsL